MNFTFAQHKLPLAIAISLASSTALATDNTTEVWATIINSSSTSIDKDDIELKQADHLSDLLRDVPGVDVGGAHSINQRINIRGLGDKDLGISIDGANQNNHMYHHMGNLLINADILKSVDVNVGTNSVVNNGLGGNVAFETKDAKDLLSAGQTIGARIHANAASNNHQGYSLTTYAQLNEKFDFLAYFTGVNRGNPKDGAGNKSIGNDGDINNFLFKVGVDINPDHRLEFSYDKYKDHGDYAPRADMGVATNASITGNNVYPTKFDRSTMTLNYESDVTENTFVKASIYKNEMTLWRDERKNPYFDYNSREAIGKHTGFNLHAETSIETGNIDHTLRYGSKVYHEKSTIHADNILKGTEKAKSVALYIEDEIAFDNGFSLTPGVRFDRYKLETISTSKSYSNTSAALAAKYQINDSWSIHASSAQLFKGPELSEIFTNAGSRMISNPNLKPETGLNNEIGFKFSEKGTFGLEKVSFGVNLFNTTINDYITETRIRGVGTDRKNGGDFKIKGFEANASVKQGNLVAKISYARSKSKSQDTGNPLDREVGDSVSLGLDYAIPAQNVNLSWTTLATLKEKHYDKPSYHVHNIAAKWAPKNIKGLTLTAGIENIFDEKYTSHASRIGDSAHPRFGQLHLNDYEPGRNFKLSAAYKF